MAISEKNGQVPHCMTENSLFYRYTYVCDIHAIRINQLFGPL